jgi:hypothetical protein
MGRTWTSQAGKMKMTVSTMVGLEKRLYKGRSISRARDCLAVDSTFVGGNDEEGMTRVTKAKVGEKVIEQEESAGPSRIDEGGYRRTLTGAEAEVGRMHFRRSHH